MPFAYSHTQVGLFGVVGLAAIAATGTGLIMTPLLNLVLGLVDERQAGMASGVISMLQQIGAALGSGSVGQSGSYASAFVAGTSYNVGAILARASRK
ncbi:major facilitator superfamily MFS_1 domain protein [Brucella pseudogrignonensis]|uniref:Major facilitator superfamily MFS_1 domain protein n=1 Tax=Brucella pseudogrignonensis TaxID=419475 RepID=A0A256G4M5_9HYPH|nr:major facilitator superfamily MFS_1 domain protein [Brucella pseudogrignonensis]